MADHIFDRRTVLKTIGAGVAGGTTLVGTATAGDTGNNRRQDTFAWGQNTLFEMLESEPHPGSKDNEGNEAAHRPLWLIKPMTDTGVDGSEHSPHPAPLPFDIDHVVPLDGPSFTAQWHVHFVVEEGGKPPEDLVRTDQNGDYLTSASRIQNATNVDIIPTDVVFTCPIRPHKHNGRK
ncbi:hypothetical protein HFX_2340 [Haloferax mediterranei ATCC 33500]|uniref:Uncharacterized protein n=1 Tax=Haloferax mediterranei (strain ATCC 33500 / DSM 1411 / JCM 8866 / NBRC 14739 / NCIMB 2177 / R-4) TaxID=523841 RepID=I3R717_HALMT|nr:hypothetical protein HFX_2340 [Haloferax mediterranei ATCC 33500]